MWAGVAGPGIAWRTGSATWTVLGRMVTFWLIQGLTAA
jgi:hypothetical protein